MLVKAEHERLTIMGENMAVNVFLKGTGEKFTGKFASIEDGTVYLYSGIAPNKNGGYRGCGKKTSFTEADVEVLAHRPGEEIVVADGQ